MLGRPRQCSRATRRFRGGMPRGTRSGPPSQSPNRILSWSRGSQGVGAPGGISARPGSAKLSRLAMSARLAWSTPCDDTSTSGVRRRVACNPGHGHLPHRLVRWLWLEVRWRAAVFGFWRHRSTRFILCRHLSAYHSAFEGHNDSSRAGAALRRARLYTMNHRSDCMRRSSTVPTLRQADARVPRWLARRAD